MSLAQRIRDRQAPPHRLRFGMKGTRVASAIPKARDTDSRCGTCDPRQTEGPLRRRRRRSSHSDWPSARSPLRGRNGWLGGPGPATARERKSAALRGDPNGPSYARHQRDRFPHARPQPPPQDDAHHAYGTHEPRRHAHRCERRSGVPRPDETVRLPWHPRSSTNSRASISGFKENPRSWRASALAS